MKTSNPPTPDQFPVTISIPIQWGDQDLFGHVNNIHFLKWFESARIAYLIECGARISSEKIGPILAAVHCDYQKQIKFPDTVTISASVSKIGNSSITIDHFLWTSDPSETAAQGQSIVVMFDYQAQKTVPVSDEIRAKINDLENKSSG